MKWAIFHTIDDFQNFIYNKPSMYSIIQKYLSKETILSGISKTFKEFTNYIQNISDRGDIINSVNLIEFFQSEIFQ